ncbi:MAG: cobalamin-dependent protein [Acidobacteriota bacterium]
MAEAMVSRHYAGHPGLIESAGGRARTRSLQEATSCLDNLAESLDVGHPLLFADFLAWTRVTLAGRDVAVEELLGDLAYLSDTLRHTLAPAPAAVAVAYVTQGSAHLTLVPATPPTCIQDDQPFGALAKAYLAALLVGDRQLASRSVLGAVDAGVSIEDVYLHVFQPCQYEVGRLWQMKTISVAQEHYCTAATQLIMSQLYPRLFGSARVGRTMVATCVAGDLHEIGVRMVADLLELDGWDTVYLGANTPIADILDAVRERKADLLAVSATIVPHLKEVAVLIEQLHATPEGRAVTTLVGGYPFNVVPGLWQQMGADGCAHDAAGSVALANRLMLARRRP